ncbi:MAG TPA: DNA recombination protein RmuC [Flavobacteriales bacterium]|nr:DNA recombination protein RmuC [Flavobacteriales bacterium]
MLYNIIYLGIGLGAGFAIGYLFKQTRPAGNTATNDDTAKELEIEKQALSINLQNAHSRMQELNRELEELKKTYQQLLTDSSGDKGRIVRSIEVFNEQKAELEKYKAENSQLLAKVSTSTEQLKNLEQKVIEAREMEKKFTVEFENLANRILEEKTQKFTLQNKEQLGQLINPFQEKIREFEKKVEETYVKGAKENSALMEQVKQLAELNVQMRTEAQNLTTALKGDKKQQGNWGELILEKVLERSGLTNGQEYELQFSTTGTDGMRIQPDVVIKLPDNKHVIIDSKVSLNAYTEWVNEADEVLREGHLKTHITSIKNHIKSLSEKNYHAGRDFNSPEFVLLFIPVESSFSTIIQHDNDVWNYAWDRKIVLVSPSTLLATLRTIASVWKQEKQNANSLEIARQAGDLYDKFVGFLEDMTAIEKNLEQTQRAYAGAMNKLKEGNGNLIRRTEKLKELGVKSEKSIPQKFTDTLE